MQKGKVDRKVAMVPFRYEQYRKMNDWLLAPLVEAEKHIGVRAGVRVKFKFKNWALSNGW